MQNLNLSLIRSYSEMNESVRFGSDPQDHQQEPIVCSYCGTHCQTSGKVKNSWYALCQCGAYIQLCPNSDDYFD